ncbi:MAG: extracellular solute-binding protein [Thioalkalispiraceae bacterium]|jgi:iron(III) transport system substrate-binding protein
MKQGIITLLTIWIISSASQVMAEELIIFSGRSDKFVKPVVKEFTKQTGIKVVLHTGSSTALLNKLKLEGERTEADLFISNDAGNLQKGSELGLFQPIDAKLVGAIPENYRAGDNSWVGLSARARVLVVNQNAEGVDFVKSVFDLADPRLKGKLAITHSSNESYIAGATVYMRATSADKVKSWLSGMKANVGNSVFNKHSKIVKAVASGRKSVGLVNHYYIYRHLAKHPDAPIKIVLPDQDKAGMGIAWNVAGAAIVKHTAKTEAAKKLIDFMVSEQGQKLFAEVNREYPTRPGVPAADNVPKRSSYKVANIPMRELGEYRDATLDIIESVGMP